MEGSFIWLTKSRALADQQAHTSQMVQLAERAYTSVRFHHDLKGTGVRAMRSESIDNSSKRMWSHYGRGGEDGF